MSATDSKLTKSQKRRWIAPIKYGGEDCQIIAIVRYDDECGNGHNTFSVTGEIAGPVQYAENAHGSRRMIPDSRIRACGCIHDEIARAIPELAPYIKWHLCSSDGPMHYPANALYHAGDRDCWGLRKGEFRQHTSRGKQNNGVAGVPNWVLKIPEDIKTDVYATDKPPPVTIEWQPYGMTGEGKERDFAAARSCAIWPEATDEQLSSPDLKQMLEARLPALMIEFRAAVESLGFTW